MIGWIDCLKLIEFSNLYKKILHLLLNMIIFLKSMFLGVDNESRQKKLLHEAQSAAIIFYAGYE